MGQLQLKRYTEIVGRMRNRVIARTDVTDLEQTGSVNQVLSAAAREDDEQYFQMGKLLAIFDIDTAEGDDLDEVAKAVNPDAISRISKRKATGAVIFGRTGTSGTTTISQGQTVQVPGTSLIYETTEEGSILNGFSDSAAVPISALVAGAEYNVDPTTVTAFGSAPSGVDSVTNPSALTNGRDLESDDALRARIKLYLKSLSRATITALVYACLGVEDTLTGQTVVFAAAVEDMINLGNVIVYIDDGAGTPASSVQVAAESVVAAAVGGEVDLYLDNKPLNTTAAYAIQVNAGLVVEGVDYTINPASGYLKMLTPLTAADAVTADYWYYDGLVQECQKIIDGDPADRAAYPGYRAGGVLVRVLVPQVVQISFTANISVKQGWSQTSVAANVSSAISGYINSLGISEDVILKELVERAMSVPGMYDIAIVTPTNNRIVLDNQIARIVAGNITIS